MDNHPNASQPHSNEATGSPPTPSPYERSRPKNSAHVLTRIWIVHLWCVAIIPCILVAFFTVDLEGRWIMLLPIAAAIIIPAAMLSLSLLIRRLRRRRLPAPPVER